MSAVKASPPGKSVALLTFGCAKNLVDSEVMLGYLRQAGYATATDEKRADILILNTCGFIRPAREEVEQGIDRAVSLKRRHPEKRLAVTGCYVERSLDELRPKYPEVDVWMGVRDFDNIVPALEGRRFRPGRSAFLCGPASPRLLSTPATWAYLKVSEGCSHQCSFCAIPRIKGPYRSRTTSSILTEARELVRLGVREINLVSQDTTYFGRDRGRKDALADLLNKLADVRGLRWIRFLYGYPEEVTPALLDAMTGTRVCRYLDLPFQHADTGVLKRMRRSLDGRRALKLVENIRKKLPGASLRTSLIVGFPGEGRREFAVLREFVREARFDHLGVFAYSPEPGTPAFGLGDPVPAREKLERQQEIMVLQAGISREINRRYLHTTLDVLLEAPVAGRRDAWTGRARFQAPEVDGVVRVRGRRPCPVGVRAMEKVEIVAAQVYDLRGNIVE
jgi:ribosomal protein S12 methylthiotransferase